MAEAMATVSSVLGSSPEQGVSYYYHELWRRQTDQQSADDFSVYTAATTSVVAEIDSDQVRDAEGILRAGMNGAILGVMVARTAYPERQSTHDIASVYGAISQDIVDSGATTTRDKGEAMRNYASLYELTLPAEVRSSLYAINQSLSGPYATTGYILSLISMYTASQMMDLDTDVHSLLQKMDEREFDTLLHIIETSPAKLNDHRPMMALAA